MTFDREEQNPRVTEEFRANGGTVGGSFENIPLILVHHKGGKTGTDRVNPLVYQQVGDAWAVFASKGGAPADPHWFLNLVANPDTTIEVGSETIPVHARVAEGDERMKIWEAQKAALPQFAQYEADAGREIPVVVFDRR